MNYQIVTQKLKDLGWSWSNPRITAYISDLSKIHRREYSPLSLPLKHYKKLMERLEVIERINLHLKEMSANWNDPLIDDFFNNNSVKDDLGNATKRLKFNQWLKLEQFVQDEIICPF